MKKIYPFLFAALTSVTFAQQTISFEAAEGYQTGTINTQNGWEVTEGSDGFLQNQVITDETASDGTFSFKNAYEPDFSDQWLPIFGAVQILNEPVDYTNFSISYDIKVTEQMLSDFEFTIYAVNEDELFTPIAGVGIENRGFIYVITDENYGTEYTDAEWTANEWINVRIEVDTAEVRYFIDNNLVYSLDNFTNLNISGFNMLHNNYGADAYYDNIQITTGSLSVKKSDDTLLSVFPNPAKDIITITTPKNVQVATVKIINVTGQEIMNTAITENINVSHLTAGIYFIKASTTDGQTITKKFVKK